jgi:hypothetical protein
MHAMPLKVCLSTANTLLYPQGGHLWVFINWALGLRACNCEVTWLDVVPISVSLDELCARYEQLRKILSTFGLAQNLVVDFSCNEEVEAPLREAALPSLQALGPFDLLVDLRYDLPERLFAAFRRKVLINIDPGQYEEALADGVYPYPKHDLLFSIGENAVTGHEKWEHTPPCVFLGEWPYTVGSRDAPWTTIAHWWGDDYFDSKRQGFRPVMTIPSQVRRARFELALNLEHTEEQRRIEAYGFKVHDAHKVAASPAEYRSFIQNSIGEFSCAKPSYVRRQTAWISDRTVNYLASGRPCVVENTGPSSFLPSDFGLHRFSNFDGAVKALERVMENYDAECRAARLLAEEFFDARKVCNSLLSRSI